MFEDIPSGNPPVHPCLDKWLGRTDEAEHRGYYTKKDRKDAFGWPTCAVGIEPPPGRLKNIGIMFSQAVQRDNFLRCREIIAAIRAELTTTTGMDAAAHAAATAYRNLK